MTEAISSQLARLRSGLVQWSSFSLDRIRAAYASFEQIRASRPDPLLAIDFGPYSLTIIPSPSRSLSSKKRKRLSRPRSPGKLSLLALG